MHMSRGFGKGGHPEEGARRLSLGTQGRAHHLERDGTPAESVTRIVGHARWRAESVTRIDSSLSQ